MKDLHLRALEPLDEMIVRAMHDDFMREEKFEFLLFDGDWNAVLHQSRKLARGIDLPEGYVPAAFLLAEVAGEVVGRVSIRYELNDYLRRYGGHIGYAVAAQHRRKGYASEILRQSLDLLARRGLTRALITCHDKNIGSIRVIENNGGVLENKITNGAQLSRRYWINLGG